jgi:selenocysteine lyase/cysteine desulfurase
LFCRAEEREATTLLDALKNCDEASGQAINMQKSEIFFSKNTSEAIKEKMQNIFQVTESKDQANILVYHLW